MKRLTTKSERKSNIATFFSRVFLDIKNWREKYINQSLRIAELEQQIAFQKEIKEKLIASANQKLECLEKDISFLSEQRKYDLEKINKFELALARERQEKELAIKILKKCVTETGSCYGCINFDGKKCTDKEKAKTCDTKGADFWEWGGLNDY